MTDSLTLMLSYRRIYNVWSPLEALGVWQGDSEARVKASPHCQHFKNPGTLFFFPIPFFLAFSKQTLKNNNKKAKKQKILSI